MFNEYGRLTSKGMIVLVVIAIVMVGILIIGNQWFKVFVAEQEGKAELSQAEWNRQIIVRQAQAKKDAASLEAEAEVLRAAGVSKANLIIGDSLKNNEAYLRYLFVNNLAETKDHVIYIPTEAGLPILEAGKR